MNWSIIDIQYLDQSNWKISDWIFLCHVILYCERHIYVNAPSCHLPNIVQCVTLENGEFHIQFIVLSQYPNPLNISVWGCELRTYS